MTRAAPYVLTPGPGSPVAKQPVDLGTRPHLVGLQGV